MFFILFCLPPEHTRKTISLEEDKVVSKSTRSWNHFSVFFRVLLLTWIKSREKSPEINIDYLTPDMLSTSSDENWYYVDINTRKWRLIEFIQRTKLVAHIRHVEERRFKSRQKKRSMLPVVEYELSMLVPSNYLEKSQRYQLTRIKPLTHAALNLQLVSLILKTTFFPQINTASWESPECWLLCNYTCVCIQHSGLSIIQNHWLRWWWGLVKIP